MTAYILSTNAAELRAAHRDLLVPSFRAAELIPEDDFVAQFADRAEAVLARDDDGLLIGIAVVEQFRDAVLLQYLAVDPSRRSNGVGSGLLETILTRCPRAAAVILAEFDRPDAHPAHPIQGDPEARLRFYARHGAVALDLPYFQPPITADEERVHGMLLAVFDLDGAITQHGRLSTAQSTGVRNYLDDILDQADDRDARRLREAARGDIRTHALLAYPDVPRSPLQDTARA